MQTYDEKPKRRLFEVLRSQGLSMNQQVEFLSDGGEEQYELRPQVEQQLESIKGYLWHGNTFQALNKLESLQMDLEAAAYEGPNCHAVIHCRIPPYSIEEVQHFLKSRRSGRR